MASNSCDVREMIEGRKELFLVNNIGRAKLHQVFSGFNIHFFGPNGHYISFHILIDSNDKIFIIRRYIIHRCISVWVGTGTTHLCRKKDGFYSQSNLWILRNILFCLGPHFCNRPDLTGNHGIAPNTFEQLFEILCSQVNLRCLSGLQRTIPRGFASLQS